MCNQFHYESTWLYNKAIMWNIKKKLCYYIFCNNNLYHKMRWWLDGKGLRLWLRNWRFKLDVGNVVSMTSSWGLVIGLTNPIKKIYKTIIGFSIGFYSKKKTKNDKNKKNHHLNMKTIIKHELRLNWKLIDN
jgi:hypothetical protein